jgi:hypothetical protein
LIHRAAGVDEAAALSGEILILERRYRGIEVIAADPRDHARIETALRAAACPGNAV